LVESDQTTLKVGRLFTSSCKRNRQCKNSAVSVVND